MLPAGPSTAREFVLIQQPAAPGFLDVTRTPAALGDRGGTLAPGDLPLRMALLVALALHAAGRHANGHLRAAGGVKGELDGTLAVIAAVCGALVWRRHPAFIQKNARRGAGGFADGARAVLAGPCRFKRPIGDDDATGLSRVVGSRLNFARSGPS